MKKYSLLFTLLILMVLQPLAAGDSDDDPLAESRVLRYGGGDEIIGFNGSVITVSKYFHAMEVTPTDTVLTVLTYQTGWNWWEPSVVTTINVNDNELSDIVAVRVYHSDNIDIIALRADPIYLSVDTLANWEIETEIIKTGPVRFRDSWHVSSHPMLYSGDFSGDGKDEFVLGYWAKDDQQNPSLYLVVYDADIDLVVTEIASVMDQPVAVPPMLEGFEAEFTIYDMTTGDFNGDGKSEILLAGREARESGGWNLFVNVYSYEAGNNSLVRTRKDTLVSVTDDSSELINVKVIDGYMNREDRQQAIVYFTQLNKINNKADTSYSYMTALSYDESFSQITTSEPFLQGIGSSSVYPEVYLTLKSRDINGSGFEEIFSGFSPYSLYWGDDEYFRIYQLDDQFQFIEYANLDYISPYLMTLGNVILDTTGEADSPELIVGSFPIVVYTIDIDEDGSFLGVTQAGSVYGWFGSLTTADLDGDIRLGPPKRSRITDIVQPLVILNAPPTHFDIFNGVPYDVNKSYYPYQSLFIATYEENKEQKIEMETEFHRDWGVSAEISAGGGIKGFSVSGYLRGKYGEQFSERGGSSTTVSVNVQANAIVDDLIYATIVDYELWEYPVLANGIERGHILVVDPGLTGKAWFPRKSWTGYSYVPNHEVGNILSYRNYPDFSGNPMLDKKIKGEHAVFFVLDENTFYTWGLKWEDFKEKEEIKSHDYSIEMGAEVSKWGVTLAVDGHYAAGEINTQRSSMREGLSINIQLAGIDVGLGEVGFRVIPYTYWADNGALVLDYAVQPELAQPGYTPTWWQNRYGNKPDPAFILPWRYDPEKNRALEDPAKRYQTHDITFFPANPDEGEIVTITARIHNFSLLPTSSPVGVSFYVGDPDDGGTLIVGEGNKTIVYTDGAIPDRGRKEVQMNWTVPANIGSFPRIYALIDPEGHIDEIHDNNNKGWNVLGMQPVVGIEESIVGLPSEYTLYQNYPNPFNPGTTIEFSIPRSGLVTLEVYNILGQKIATLISEELFAGNHSYYWDAGLLASGVYIYRLQAGEFAESKKLLLLK